MNTIKKLSFVNEIKKTNIRLKNENSLNPIKKLFEHSTIIDRHKNIYPASNLQH